MVRKKKNWPCDYISSTGDQKKQQFVFLTTSHHLVVTETKHPYLRNRWTKLEIFFLKLFVENENNISANIEILGVWVTNLQNICWIIMKWPRISVNINASILKRTHKKGNWLCVLHSLHGLARQSCQLESPRLQQAKHATSTKHFVNWDWTASKCSDTRHKWTFPGNHFLDSSHKK